MRFGHSELLPESDLLVWLKPFEKVGVILAAVSPLVAEAALLLSLAAARGSRAWRAG
jgi:hypothetical protein